MVQEGSVVRSSHDLGVTFVLTDHQGADFTVQYTGILPDLFREGQGILVEGQLNAAGVFSATEVLAKHDENYMPPELMDLQGMEPPATPKASCRGIPRRKARRIRPRIALMIPELGNFALSLAAVLALGGSVMGLAAPRDDVLQRATMSMVFGQWAFSLLAFAALVYAFVADDFSVAYVANQSNTLLPWYYKVSAAWGGHEGSFLLWILIMGCWMAAFSLRSGQYPCILPPVC